MNDNKITIIGPTTPISCHANIPASKSISNRLLIMQALAGDGFQIENLSEAADTLLLRYLIETLPETIDCANAGTALRFITAYLSMLKGRSFIVTGDTSMKKRPVTPLVNCLKQLGADIAYLEKDGFPPLKITGKQLSSNPVSIDGSISSQFISAVLLIAPYLPDGLIIKLIPPVVSLPYIMITMALMRKAGIKLKVANNTIFIQPGKYKKQKYLCENDWSSASYWYAIAGLSEKCSINLNNLNHSSIQGDKMIYQWFAKWGIESVFKDNGLSIESNQKFFPKWVKLNMVKYPDLVQTLSVFFTLAQIPYTLYGINNLIFKETNRIEALRTELPKIGASGLFIDNDAVVCHKFCPDYTRTPIIETYGDHRMAMAFSVASMRFNNIIVKTPGLVTKSYPGYWKQLSNAGFQCLLS